MNIIAFFWRRQLSALASAALTLCICGAPVAGATREMPLKTQLVFDAYPARSIRMIVASSPGTASDFFARVLGQELAATYGRTVTIDNRAGAGGLIGNAMMSKANGDGHTLGMVDVTRIITELLRAQPPYFALADVIGVAHVASITNVLAITPTVLARTAPEFVRYARARHGDLNFASLGIGSASHLAADVFTRAVGIGAVHVPYRNLSDSFVEMRLGRVHYAVYTLPSVLAPVREGQLRALAVMTPQRSPVLPAVPAISEVGLPEAQFDSWSGVVTPKGTPRRIVEQLHGDIVRALRKPELRELFVRQGAESTPDGTPDGFMRMMQVEYARYQLLMRDEGIKPQ